MSGVEPALRTLRALVLLELAEAADDVAEAVGDRRRALHLAGVVERRCAALADEMRRAPGQLLADPTCELVLRRLHRSEASALAQAHSAVSEAASRETRCREHLSGVRHRDKGLERAQARVVTARRAHQERTVAEAVSELTARHAGRQDR